MAHQMNKFVHTFYLSSVDKHTLDRLSSVPVKICSAHEKDHQLTARHTRSALEDLQFLQGGQSVPVRIFTTREEDQ